MRIAGIVAGLLFGWGCVASANAPPGNDLQYLGPYTYLPGKHVELHFGTRAPHGATISVTIYPLSVDRAMRIPTWFYSFNFPVKELQGLTPVATGTVRAGDGAQTTTFDAGVLPIGYYGMVADSAGERVGGVLGVTSLGIVITRSSNAHTIMLVDLTTMNRYRGVASVGVESGSARRPLTSRSDGLFIDVPAQGDTTVVAAGADGSIAYAYAGSSEDARDTGIVQTDRPIYRPGQAVNLRVVLRSGTVGRYAIPRGKLRVRVESPYPDNATVFERELPVSRFGTVSATVPLPQDALIGQYDVSAGSISGRFVVAAYKKPEYKLTIALPHDFVVGGETATFHLNASYFFGRPAAGIHLHFRADARILVEEPDYRFFFLRPLAPYSPPRRVTLGEGDVVADASGNADVAVATPLVGLESRAQIRVDARDSSGRTVTATLGTAIVPAPARIDIEPNRWFAAVARPMSVGITSSDYDGNPIANQPIHLRFVYRVWNERLQHYDESDAQTVDLSTGADGKAVADWTPSAGGLYAIEATSGTAGRVARASSEVMAFDDSASLGLRFEQEEPGVIAQRGTIGPGEKAHVLIVPPRPGADVLVIVTSDVQERAEILHVSGTSAAIDVAPPKDAAHFVVNAIVASDAGGAASGSADIEVAPAPRSLRISIRPDRARYEPGEQARFSIDVRDARGHPAVAEVGMGVVDEAIYALASNRTGSPFDAFYRERVPAFAHDSWDFAVRPYRFGLYTIANVSSEAAMAAPGTMAGNADTARSIFADTAFWSPSIVTNASGKASISFTWPDNLTTWRASGIGVTEAMAIGSATADALVTKDFLVRLEMPRFLRAGDRSTITGIAHGLAADPFVNLRLDAPYLGALQLVQSLRLDSNATASASWNVTAPGVGELPIALFGSDGIRKDGMREQLPLEAGTAAEHIRDAGSAAERPSLAVAIPGGYVAGDVHIVLSPSRLAELLESVRLLRIYPYDCTEQTISAALPAVYVAALPAAAHLPQITDLRVGETIALAMDRLAHLQHTDGSFGWWENDAPHPFMTAYAVYAMAEFKKAGFETNYSVSRDALESLERQLGDASNRDTLRFWGGRQRGSEWNTRAFMLFALADADAKAVPTGMIHEAAAHVGELNAYAIAVLGLAAHATGDDEIARKLLAEVNRRETDDGAFTYWRGETWDYAWENDPVETTAYVLRFEAALDPSSPRIPRIAAFLAAQRRGGWWYTTKDTAASIYALSAVYDSTSELQPDETIRVLANGRVVRSLHVTSPLLDAADAHVVVPASSMRDGGTISFERTGHGALYWSSDAVRYVPESATATSDPATPLLERLFSAPQVSVTRRYDVGHAGPWRVGDRVNVEVTVVARNDVQYVAIEDPFPAGAEHAVAQGQADYEAWSGVRLLDDRATFFADSIGPNQPLQLHYSLVATTPGRYTAPATSVYAMYGPPVSALGRPQDIEVVP